LCFRLQEPGPEDDPWQVEYLLQSRKDPSLRLPANDVWQAKTKALAELRQDAGTLREYLLVSLGQASGVSAEVDGSLKQSAPGGYALDVLGAHNFLRETAPALEQS